MKKIITYFLSIFMVITLLPFNAVLAEEDTVYLDTTGSTQDAYTSLMDAANALPSSGGTIVVVKDSVTSDASTTPTLPDKPIKIVGETAGVKLTQARALKISNDLTLENITYVNNTTNYNNIYLRGHNFTVGENVTTSPKSNAYINIAFGDSAAVTGSSVVTINSGTWRTVFCGGFGKAYSGTGTLILNGGKINTLNYSGTQTGGNSTATVDVIINGGEIGTVDKNSSAGKFTGTGTLTLKGGTIGTISNVGYDIDLSGNKTITLTDSLAPNSITGGGIIKLSSDVAVVAKSLTGNINLDIDSPVVNTTYLTINDATTSGEVTFSSDDYELEKVVGDSSVTWTLIAKGEPPVQDDNIYLDPTGQTPNSYTTFANACAAAKDGSTIVVCGDIDCGPSSATTKTPEFGIKVVGKTKETKFNLTRSFTLQGDFELDNITFVDTGSNHNIFCQSHNLTIGENVVCVPNGETYPSIHGGTSGTDSEDHIQTITVKSGTWQNICAGGYGTNGSAQKAFHGTVTVNVENAEVINKLCPGNRNGGTNDATVTMNIKNSTIESLIDKMKGTYTGTYYINLIGNNTINNISNVNVAIDDANGGTVTIGDNCLLAASTFNGNINVKITNPVHEQTYITISDKTSTGTINYVTEGREVLEKVVGENNITYVMNNDIKTSVRINYYNPLGSDKTQPNIVLYKGYSADTNKTKILDYQSGNESGHNYIIAQLDSGLYYYEVYYNAANDYIKKYFYIQGNETEQVVYDCPIEPYEENGWDETVASIATDGIVERYFNFDYITGVDEENTDTPNTPTFTNHSDSIRDFMNNDDLIDYVGSLESDYLKVFYPFELSELGNATPVLVFTKDDISNCNTLAEVGEVVNSKGNREVLMIDGGQHGNEPAGEEGALQFAYDLCGNYGDELLDDIACVVMIPSVSVDNNQRFKRNYEDGCNSNRDLFMLEHEGSEHIATVYNWFMPSMFISCHEDNAPLAMDSSTNSTQDGFHNLSFSMLGSPNGSSFDVNRIASGEITMFDTLQGQLSQQIITKANEQGFYAIHYPAPSYNGVSERSYSAIRGSFSCLIEVTRINSFKEYYEFAVNEMTCSIKNVVGRFIDYNKENPDNTLAKIVADGRENAKVTEYDEDNVFILKASAVSGGNENYPILHADGSVYKQNTRTFKVFSTATATRPLPLSYVIPADLEHIDEILSLLNKQGIEYTSLPAGITKALKAYSISEGSAGMKNCSASLGVNKLVTFENGAYEISLNQLNTYLIAYLFEPDSYSSAETLYTSSLYKMGYIGLTDGLYRYESNEVPTGDPCDVTFVVNGEEYDKYEDVEFNALIEEPTAPELPEKVFDGWYKEDTFEHKFNFNTETVTNDLTLYAKFLDCHTVSFLENSAKGFVPGVVKTTDAGGWTAEGSNGLSKAQAFDKTNAKARVTGNYSDSDGKDTTKDASGNTLGTGVFVTTNTGTVKKIVFEFGENTVELTNAAKLPGASAGSGNNYLSASGFSSTKPATPILNYVHNANTAGFNLRFYNISQDIKITVYYEGSTVTFMNGNDVYETYEDVLYGATLPEIPVAPENEEHFLGWYTIDGDASYKLTEETLITKDLVFYPKYDDVTYNVTVDHGTSAGLITEKLTNVLEEEYSDGNQYLKGKAYAGIQDRGTGTQNRYAQANGYSSLDSIDIKLADITLNVSCDITNTANIWLYKVDDSYGLYNAAQNEGTYIMKLSVQEAVTYIRILTVDNDITITFNYTDNAVPEIEMNTNLVDDKVALGFKLDLPSDVSEDSVYVLVNGEKHALSEYEKENDSIVLTTPSFAIKGLADDVSMQLMSNDDKAMSNEIKTSVKKYLVSIIDSQTQGDDMKHFAKTMLNYGAYTQIYFDYNVDNLANSGVDDLPDISGVVADGEDQYEPSGETLGAKLYGCSLLLGDTTDLYVYLKLEGNLDEYSAYDETDSKALEIVEDINNPGLYYLTLSGIPAPELSIKHDILIKRNDEGALKVSISPLSYAYLVIEKNPDFNSDLTNVMKAMYMYSDAAIEINK